MIQEEMNQPDYGTGHKKLSIYIFGVISCIILTIFSFCTVMSEHFTKGEAYTIIYALALIQFVIQVICFLRLNTKNERARINVMSILFTIVILITIVFGSLWIMWNLNYYMMH
jgi:cytochrome o ubiquinol oxidase operon protein cyoD